MMAESEIKKTQYEDRRKYFREHRENLNINLEKGKKDIWKAYAAERGLTLTQYITKLIEDDNSPKK